MKKLLVIFLQFLMLCQAYGQNDTLTISCDVTNISLEKFIDIVQSQANVKVFYSKESIKNVRISLSANSIELTEAFTRTLSAYNLKPTWWNKSIVIVDQEFSFTTLPSYTEPAYKSEKIDLNQDFLTETERKYLTGRRPDAVKTIEVGSKARANSNAKAKIKGTLKDESSGEPLIGATMLIEENGIGAASDYNGQITLAIKPGKYNVRFDCLGQKSATYMLIILSDGEFSVSMEKSILQLDEVVVYGDKSMNIVTRDAGMERIPLKTIKELPTMMGERDIIKVSELLPGIVSVGEGVSGINVRGGSNDQNGFYINKIPIYNTSHVFGFFPAFNPDIIKDFSIYKGHVPAEYGGRISSIFNILARQGNRKRFNIRGGLNPITSNLTVEGPFIKDTSSFLLSLRSSYSDWILSRIDDPTIRQSNCNFSDFVAAANFDPNSKNQLAFFSYYSTDKFKLSDINEYSYSNLGASLEWSHTYSPTTRSELSAIFSQYAFGTIDTNTPTLAYQHSYSISHYEMRGTFSHLLNEKNKLEGGVTAIGYNLIRGTVEPYSNESLRIPVELGSEKGFETALFFADTYDPIPWLNVYLGLRYSFFAPLGERNVFTYQPNLPRDNRYIADTLSFGSLQPIKWYHGPEVRASVNIKTDANGSVKFAFNQNRQNLFMLNNTITISPNTQWKLADFHLEPTVGRQLSLGIFRNIPKISTEFSVESFLKYVGNLTEFKDGANFTETPQVETMVLQGNQNAYGVEFMVRKTSGRFNGWVAYTYSRSMVRVDGEEFWEKINQGISYPSNYDIPHVLNLVANYRFSRRVNISSTATYQKGRPVTYPISVYYIDGMPVIEYSQRNEFRIPDYFRIDFSLSLEGNLKRKKLFHSSWVFGVYNATGRKNPLSIFFKTEDGKIKGYKYSIIGTPVFTATWVFKLGNYAAD